MKTRFLAAAVFLLTACSTTKHSQRKQSTFVDERDGHVYKTVTIGNRVWMAENLAYAVKDNESLIRCQPYNLDVANIKLYGMLYSFNALANAAPKGWHIPSNGEWQQMLQLCPNPVETLNITYGGKGRATKFSGLGETAVFYTTSHNGTPVITRNVDKGNETITTSEIGIAWMLSVRCVKDTI